MKCVPGCRGRGFCGIPDCPVHFLLCPFPTPFQTGPSPLPSNPHPTPCPTPSLKKPIREAFECDRHSQGGISFPDSPILTNDSAHHQVLRPEGLPVIIRQIPDCRISDPSDEEPSLSCESRSRLQVLEVRRFTHLSQVYLAHVLLGM